MDGIGIPGGGAGGAGGGGGAAIPGIAMGGNPPGWEGPLGIIEDSGAVEVGGAVYPVGGGGGGGGTATFCCGGAPVLGNPPGAGGGGGGGGAAGWGRAGCVSGTGAGPVGRDSPILLCWGLDDE